MGEIRAHPPVKYFAAVTFSPDLSLDLVFREMEEHFSKIEYTSDEYDFSAFTDYYEDEMGKFLRKKIAVFAKLFEPEKLADFKVISNTIENNFQKDKNRQINIDIGYLSEAKVVLATTKNYTHRLYLGQGIFGDVHLIYVNKSFTFQPWTYPDYKQPILIDFFNGLRSNYFHQLGEKYG